MVYQERTAERLLAFIGECPTPFHTVETMSGRLLENGFERLREENHWLLKAGGKYFVTRNHSALIAFAIPGGGADRFHILASHSDSPTFKIKENPEMKVDDAYIKLNVEGYGGALLAPWFDRPLSVAGRVLVRREAPGMAGCESWAEREASGLCGGMEERLVCIDRDLLLIPSLAIHMNRDVNRGYAYRVQEDMLPLYGLADAKGTFRNLIAEAAGTKPEDILGHDLFLYVRTPGAIWGANREFISGSRLDDLQCAYASLEGFLSGTKEKSVAVHCVLDNEEVGSGTRQGAASTFLQDTLRRISMGLGAAHGGAPGTGRTYEDYLVMLAKSFMISADNAHALHPNYEGKADPVNHPVINRGIVLKQSANQKYCTDAVSAAWFRGICGRAGVPCQVFTNHSDIAGGSTLGNISGTQVAVSTVDIGLAQLAMHSPYETAGVKDTDYLIRAAREFFS